MKIAIKFGDNDFHATFRGVLWFILIGWKYNRVELTKAEYLNIINECSATAYKLFQNPLCLESTKEYLQIEIGQVFLNEEVDEVLKSDMMNWNHDCFILDTDIWLNSGDEYDAVYSI